MSLRQKLELVKKTMTSIGFSVEEAEYQITEVGKIVTMAILERLVKEKSELKELTVQQFEEHIKKSYNPQYLKLVVQEESNNIVTGYLNEITKDLPKDKKDTFIKKLE